MKYALCLRGISYYENYPYNTTSNPFTIDFSDTVSSYYENIINPLRNSGDTVDIYMTTYQSKKLEVFIQTLDPKDVTIREFINVGPGNNKNIFRGMIDCMEMVKKSNSIYDYIIVARFDTLIIENIKNIYMPHNCLSTITPRDDSFFIFTYNLLDKFIYFFNIFMEKNILTHDYTAILTNNGYRCHTIYSNVKDQKKFPFYKFSRLIFNHKDHEFFLCKKEDLYDNQSMYYSFLYKPNLEFTPYVNPDL